jgi:hypothetical protein
MNAYDIQNILHDEFINNGWVKSTNTSNNKYVYKHSKLDDFIFDEFIFDYSSDNEVAITVPIPFKNSSISYRNSFSLKNITDIRDYIKTHLSNNQ